MVRGRTLVLAAFGLCLGAIEVSVGPTESVILEMRWWSYDPCFSYQYRYLRNSRKYIILLFIPNLMEPFIDYIKFMNTWLLSCFSWQPPHWLLEVLGATWGWGISGNQQENSVTECLVEKLERPCVCDLQGDLAQDNLFQLIWRQSGTLGKCLVSSLGLVRACILENPHRSWMLDIGQLFSLATRWGCWSITTHSESELSKANKAAVTDQPWPVLTSLSGVKA